MRKQKLAQALLGAMLVLGGSSGLALAQPGKVIPLPSADAKMLHELLGKGVVGKAVPAEPIADVAKYLPLEEGTRKYQLTSGDDKGKTEVHQVSPSKRSKQSWTYKAGSSDLHHVHQDKDGSIRITATVENAHAVISRFQPAEPILLAGFNPGESKKIEMNVKVYDLKDLKDVSHEGKVSVTFTYVGAYEVKVPAGTFNASLFKWHYKGKIGPAHLDDLQYRFFAKGTGPVAGIDKKSISAVLVYHDNSKFGKVLLEK